MEKKSERVPPAAVARTAGAGANAGAEADAPQSPENSRPNTGQSNLGSPSSRPTTAATDTSGLDEVATSTVGVSGTH